MKQIIGLGLTLFAAFMSAGCWYMGYSNGMSDNLTFAVQAEGAIAGVNLPFHLSVIHYPMQVQTICTRPLAEPSAAGPPGARPQGGNPCPGGESYLDTTPIVLEEAHCDVGACTVSDDSAQARTPGSVLLRVTPTHAGSITLHVSVRATDGSDSWDDAYSVTVKDVDRLVWQHLLPDDAPASFGVLPGTPVAWNPQAVAADGQYLAAAPVAFHTEWQGDAFVMDSDGVVRAQKAGVATVTMSAAGKTKTESLRVVDPNDVTAIEVRSGIEFGNPNSGRGAWFDVESDVSQGDALSSIELDAGPAQIGPFVLVLTLRDGTRALGGAQSLAIDGIPKTLFGPRVIAPSEPYAWTFWLDTGGDGAGSKVTLTASVGQGTLALPLILGGEITDSGAGDGG